MIKINLGVSKRRGTPKSSILIGFSIINHPFWVPLFLETPIYFLKGTLVTLSIHWFSSVYAGSMVWIWWKASQVVWGWSSNTFEICCFYFFRGKLSRKKDPEGFQLLDYVFLDLFSHEVQPLEEWDKYFVSTVFVSPWERSHLCQNGSLKSWNHQPFWMVGNGVTTTLLGTDISR